MKVVINRCFGGFSLSPKATLELWKRGGPIEATPVQDYYQSTDRANEDLKAWRAYVAQPTERPLFLTVFSPDESLVLNERPENRADPLLVALVEEMGDEASGAVAALQVVEIPDGIDWEIDEYDGLERIAEKHRTWA